MSVLLLENSFNSQSGKMLLAEEELTVPWREYHIAAKYRLIPFSTQRKEKVSVKVRECT